MSIWNTIFSYIIANIAGINLIETLLTTGFLLPFEILLPILGVLLIRSFHQSIL